MKAHDAARIAMAQTEEPRAWFTTDEINAWAEKKLKENPQWTSDWNTEAVRPLTFEWASLTDDELLKTYGWEFEAYGQSYRPSSLGQSIVDEAKQEIIDGLRKVEAALKKKNT